MFTSSASENCSRTEEEEDEVDDEARRGFEGGKANHRSTLFQEPDRAPDATKSSHAKPTCKAKSI